MRRAGGVLSRVLAGRGAEPRRRDEDLMRSRSPRRARCMRPVMVSRAGSPLWTMWYMTSVIGAATPIRSASW